MLNQQPLVIKNDAFCFTRLHPNMSIVGMRSKK